MEPVAYLGYGYCTIESENTELRVLRAALLASVRRTRHKEGPKHMAATWEGWRDSATCSPKRLAFPPSRHAAQRDNNTSTTPFSIDGEISSRPSYRGYGNQDLIVHSWYNLVRHFEYSQRPPRTTHQTQAPLPFLHPTRYLPRPHRRRNKRKLHQVLILMVSKPRLIKLDPRHNLRIRTRKLDNCIGLPPPGPITLVCTQPTCL